MNFDLSEYNRQVQEFIKASGKDGGVVLRDETRLLTDEFVASTPPFSSTRVRGGRGGAKGTPRAFGEAAVVRDIKKVFRTVGDIPMYRKPRLRKILENGSLPAIEALFKRGNIRFSRITQLVDPMDHLRQRTSKGRVRKSPEITYVIQKASLDGYIAEGKKNVGKARAGWMRAVTAFGGKKLPGWVTDKPQPGIGLDETRNTENPFVRVANLVPWIQRIEGDYGCVAVAVRARIAKIKDKIQAAITGAWKKTKPRKKPS